MRSTLLSTRRLGDYELRVYPGFMDLAYAGEGEPIATYPITTLAPTEDQLVSAAVEVLLDIYEDQRVRCPDASEEERAARALQTLDPRNAPYTEKQKRALVVLHRGRRSERWRSR